MTTIPISMDQLHDLWGAGFTIVQRPRDPFEIDPKLIPRGMSYQWNDEPEKPGWSPVMHSRHPGVFAPWGTKGDIEVGGLYLCERPEEVTRKAREQAESRARQQVHDWAMQAGAHGITGSVKVGVGELPNKLVSLDETVITPDGKIITETSTPYQRVETKTIETTVGVPVDMYQHMSAVFAERDRLEAEVVRKDRTLVPGPVADKFRDAIEDNPNAQWWPTLRAILLPIAVENVRKQLKVIARDKIDDEVYRAQFKQEKTDD